MMRRNKATSLQSKFPDSQDLPALRYSGQKKKHFIILIFLGIVTVSAVYFFFFRGKRIDLEAGLSFQGQFISVEAEELFQAYITNEGEADQRFGRKGLEITGRIQGIKGAFDKNCKVEELVSLSRTMFQNGINDDLVMTKELGVVFVIPTATADNFWKTKLKLGASVTLQGVCAGVVVDPEKSSRRFVVITGTRLLQ